MLLAARDGWKEKNVFIFSGSSTYPSIPKEIHGYNPSQFEGRHYKPIYKVVEHSES